MSHHKCWLVSPPPPPYPPPHIACSQAPPPISCDENGHKQCQTHHLCPRYVFFFPPSYFLTDDFFRFHQCFEPPCVFFYHHHHTHCHIFLAPLHVLEPLPPSAVVKMGTNNTSGVVYALCYIFLFTIT